MHFLQSFRGCRLRCAPLRRKTRTRLRLIKSKEDGSILRLPNIAILYKKGCGIGWVDFDFFFTFSTEGKQRSIVFTCKSVENSNKKCIGSIDLYRRGHDFLGHELYKGSNLCTDGPLCPAEILDPRITFFRCILSL
jgi:hypothetical protein